MTGRRDGPRYCLGRSQLLFPNFLLKILGGGGFVLGFCTISCCDGIELGLLVVGGLITCRSECCIDDAATPNRGEVAFRSTLFENYGRTDLGALGWSIHHRNLPYVVIYATGCLHCQVRRDAVSDVQCTDLLWCSIFHLCFWWHYLFWRQSYSGWHKSSTYNTAGWWVELQNCHCVHDCTVMTVLPSLCSSRSELWVLVLSSFSFAS